MADNLSLVQHSMLLMAVEKVVLLWSLSFLFFVPLLPLSVGRRLFFDLFYGPAGLSVHEFYQFDKALPNLSCWVLVWIE